MVAGQIWIDNCYYFDQKTGDCKVKYVLILAVDKKTGDAITAVLTSKSNGLPEIPACYIGLPRSGYFLGILGGVLMQETWVAFDSIQRLDGDDHAIHINTSRTRLSGRSLDRKTLCAVLRCAMQYEADISLKDYRLLGDTISNLTCD